MWFTLVQNSFRAWCLGQQTMLSPCSRQSEKPFEMGLNSDLRCISKIFGSGKPPRAVLDSIETFSETQFWTKQCCTQDKGLNPSKTPFQRCFGQQRHIVAHGASRGSGSPPSPPSPLPPGRERGAEGGVRAVHPGLAPWAKLFRP